MIVLLQIHKKKLLTVNLRDKVALFAGALKKQGVDKKDRVIIYMPMIPEAVIAMLACGRIGAVIQLFLEVLLQMNLLVE